MAPPDPEAEYESDILRIIDEIDVEVAAYTRRLQRREIRHSVLAISAFVLSVGAGLAFVLIFGKRFAPQVSTITLVIGILITTTVTTGAPIYRQAMNIIHVSRPRRLREFEHLGSLAHEVLESRAATVRRMAEMVYMARRAERR
ncbi:hypothetical protein [Dactylosporangium sp. NPDC005555]|uniref:hypothetical protein n=1 Tax=Dactylosporangium sp. NPDC005555 TaxID=3154889 RepID=UPI0033ACB056